jgi:hypothetical protein
MGNLINKIKKPKIVYAFKEEPKAGQIALEVIFEGKKYCGYLPKKGGK